MIMMIKQGQSKMVADQPTAVDDQCDLPAVSGVEQPGEQIETERA